MSLFIVLLCAYAETSAIKSICDPGFGLWGLSAKDSAIRLRVCVFGWDYDVGCRPLSLRIPPPITIAIANTDPTPGVRFASQFFSDLLRGIFSTGGGRVRYMYEGIILPDGKKTCNSKMLPHTPRSSTF